MSEIEEKRFAKYLTSHGLTHGGKSEPRECRPLCNIALIVPYRNRPGHLEVFLRYMHLFLMKQLLKYTIFVVEQAGKGIQFSLRFNHYRLLF